MIIKKIDISSIFPIIIKIIKLNLEVVNKFAKSTLLIPNMSAVAVLVIVRIDNLNDFSKLILSTIKIPDNINKLIKKSDIISLNTNLYSKEKLLDKKKLKLCKKNCIIINTSRPEEIDYDYLYLMLKKTQDCSKHHILGSNSSYLI